MSRIIDLLNGPPNTTTAPIPPPPPPLPGLPNPNPTTSPTTTDPTTPPIPTYPNNPQPPRPPILPLFISCDPARDTPSVLKEYLSEFHPSLVGLTGTWQQVKDMCRAYRVYFSTPEGVKPGQDYLVDHSIYFYVMGTFFPFPILFLCRSLPILPSHLSPPHPNQNLNKSTTSFPQKFTNDS